LEVKLHMCLRNIAMKMLRRHDSQVFLSLALDVGEDSATQDFESSHGVCSHRPSDTYTGQPLQATKFSPDCGQINSWPPHNCHIHKHRPYYTCIKWDFIDTLTFRYCFKCVK
jgi:hypothetical protein